MILHSRRIFVGIFFGLLAAGLLPAVRADEPKADATGTWKWSMKARNGESRDFVLKLKQEAEKLTGTVHAFNNDTEIQDGSVKDGAITFKVTRKGGNGQEIVSSYTGSLSGDTIKGKIESNFGGQTRSRDWEATRAKD